MTMSDTIKVSPLNPWGIQLNLGQLIGNSRGAGLQDQIPADRVYLKNKCHKD